MVLVVASVIPTTVKAANIANEFGSVSEMIGERTDIKFLEGNPGDTHLVYTYQQNGNTYKAAEYIY